MGIFRFNGGGTGAITKGVLHDFGGKNKQKKFKQAQPCRCSRISAAVFLNGFVHDVTEEPTEHKPFTYVLFFYCAKLFPFCVLAILCTVPSIHAFLKENQPLILSDSM